MSKTFVFASILATSVLVAGTSGQAREFSVWGNNFTTDDGPAALPRVAPLSRFNAAVAHPERYGRGTRRIQDPTW